MARTASRTSPCPVMMITGTSMPFSISFSWNSRPSMPGMRISVRMQSGRLYAAAIERRDRKIEAFHFKTGGFDQDRQRIPHALIVIDNVNEGHLASLPASSASAKRKRELELDAAPRIGCRP